MQPATLTLHTGDTVTLEADGADPIRARVVFTPADAERLARKARPQLDPRHCTRCGGLLGHGRREGRPVYVHADTRRFACATVAP